MADSTFDEVVLTADILRQFEPPPGEQKRWDVFTIPDGPLPTLERFARHGGPNLSDLRFDPDDPDSRSRQRSPISPSSLRFDNILIAYNILPPGYEFRGVPRPARYVAQMIQRTKAAMDASTMPDFELTTRHLANFRQIASFGNALQIWDTIWEYFHLAEFDPGDGFQCQELLAFQEKGSMVPGKVEPLQPRFCDGAMRDQLEEDLLEDLGPLVDPTGNRRDLIAPNFFFEVQSAMQRPGILRNKARLAGAFGARAVCLLNGHLNPEDPVNDDIAAFTATFEDSMLKVYGHSVYRPAKRDDRLVYRMELLASFAVDSNIETFVRAARLLWQVRTVANVKRNRAIAGMNRRYRARFETPLQEIYNSEHEHPGDSDDAP